MTFKVDSIGKSLSDLHELIVNGTGTLVYIRKTFLMGRYVEIPLLELIDYFQILSISGGSNLFRTF